MAYEPGAGNLSREYKFIKMKLTCCEGVSAFVLEKCGAGLSGIDKGSLRGGKVNASNWFHWMTDNAVESYHYNTIEELLAGGKAQKGDVIYFEPVSWEEEDADCHAEGIQTGNRCMGQRPSGHLPEDPGCCKSEV